MFKKYCIKLFTLKKPKTYPHFKSFNKAKNIGLLFDEQSENVSHSLKNELKKKGKKVKWLCCIENPKSNFIFSDGYFNQQDFNWMGKPISENINRFLNYKFDYLISLSATKNIMLQYILFNTETRHRVGIYKKGYENEFDLMLKLKNEDNYFEILHYLELIKNE